MSQESPKVPVDDESPSGHATEGFQNKEEFSSPEAGGTPPQIGGTKSALDIKLPDVRESVSDIKSESTQADDCETQSEEMLEIQQELEHPVPESETAPQASVHGQASPLLYDAEDGLKTKPISFLTKPVPVPEDTVATRRKNFEVLTMAALRNESVGKRPPKDMKRLDPTFWYEVLKVARWGDTPALLLQRAERVPDDVVKKTVSVHVPEPSTSSPTNEENEAGKKKGTSAFLSTKERPSFYKPPKDFAQFEFEIGDKVRLTRVGYSKSRNLVAQAIAVEPTTEVKGDPDISAQSLRLQKRKREDMKSTTLQKKSTGHPMEHFPNNLNHLLYLSQMNMSGNMPGNNLFGNDLTQASMMNNPVLAQIALQQLQAQQVLYNQLNSQIQASSMGMGTSVPGQLPHLGARPTSFETQGADLGNTGPQNNIPFQYMHLLNSMSNPATSAGNFNMTSSLGKTSMDQLRQTMLGSQLSARENTSSLQREDGAHMNYQQYMQNDQIGPNGSRNLNSSNMFQGLEALHGTSLPRRESQDQDQAVSPAVERSSGTTVSDKQSTKKLDGSSKSIENP